MGFPGFTRKYYGSKPCQLGMGYWMLDAEIGELKAES